MEEGNEWTNLPVEEKCVHKSWKARLDGYEAATRLFQCLDDDKSPEWSKYAGLLKKFVVDSNLTAQEKALDAVLAYVENYVHAGRTVGEVMSNIVQKCVGCSTKPKTKELALQISLMYIEIEKHEIVIEELLKGTESKNPKTSCACLNILTVALRDFGPKVVPVSKILKKMPIALADRDKNVRGEARNLVVEIYRWVGAPIKQQLSSLKQVQMTELEAEFEKISGGAPTPNRLLRSQQAKKAVQSSGGGVEEDDVEATDENDGDNEIDPTELLEPVDILSKLPKNFFAQLDEKKWTDRRDALELLEKELQSAPRLEPVDYGDLVRALKKIITKDSNILVIVSGLKCLTGLANGLKKKFLPYVGALIPSLLDKFKEKKQNVVVALRDTVDAVFLVSLLESISEDVVAALDNKNPCIKSEVSLFLARCFTRCSPTILNKKLLKALSTALLKVLNDSDQTARDSAASALGTAMKVVGEKGIAPFLADIGDQKMVKIKACCEAAELQKPIRVPVTENKEAKSVKTGGRTQSKAPPSKVVRPNKKEAGKTVVKPTSDLAKKLTNKLPSDIVSGLGDSDLNKRLQAYTKLSKYIQSGDLAADSVPSILEMLNSLDDDQAVVEAKITCMKDLANRNDLSTVEMKHTIVSLLKKYSDPKFNQCIAGCFADFAKSLGSDSFVQMLLQPNITSDKSLWANSVKWISEGIINYDLYFTEDLLQREAKKAIKSGHLVLRDAGLAMLGTLTMMNRDDNYKCQGAVSVNTTPTASVSPNQSKLDVKKRELKPSVDISTIITPAVLAELSDESWKTKLDTLERIKPSLENAGAISPNLGEVQNVFENLSVDKNTKVVQSALTCLAVLIKCLGTHSRKYTCYFLPKVLKNVSDPKVWVRHCVMNVLDAIGTSGGYKELFDNDTLAETCNSISLPAAKVELFSWITQTLNRVESVPNEGLIALLPVLYQSLEDRNSEVRKSSNETIVTLMMHLGYDTMLNASSNMKGSTAQAVKTLLDKNRGSVPEPAETTVVRSKSGSQLKKMNPGSSATFTKPAKGASSKSNIKIASTKRGEEAEFTDGPLFEKNNMKNQRNADELKLRTLRWNFASPRQEFIEQLQDQMTAAGVNQNLILNMFHSDFRFHIKAIDIMAEDLNSNREGMISNLDLILRWMTLRFFDTNPSVLIKGLEYLCCVFNVLIDDGYSMLDTEANSFLPYLILKAGDPKDTVKNNVRNILRQIVLLYPKQKLFSVLLDGLKSKSARLRCELLEFLCWMINTYSLDVCSPNVVTALKEICRHIGDKDTSVRNGALNCMVAAYFIMGEEMHKLVGPLPNMTNGLLEERLKRASKNRPVANIKPTLVPVAPVPREQEPMDDGEDSVENEASSTFCIYPTENPPEQLKILRSPQHRPSNLPAIVPPPPNLSEYELDNYGSVLEAAHVVTVSHPYRLDPEFFKPLPSFTMPVLEEIDLSFLDEPLKPLTNFTLPMTVSSISELPCSLDGSFDPVMKDFTDQDLEKAITAMAKIETTLYSDKANSLLPKINYLVRQLEQQLITLNQSSHPDVVNCYRGCFSLIMKFCDNSLLCEAVHESEISGLVKQLLLLLTANRLETIGQEMFLKTVNNVLIRLLQTCDRTSVLCACIVLLHESVGSSPDTKYQDYIMKCLWKLNRKLSEWDDQLNYSRMLLRINSFFVQYPTHYWRSQTKDFPLKTVKTILHSMVKLRGTQMNDELRKVKEISRDSEIHSYIVKVIRVLESQNELPVAKNPTNSNENANSNDGSLEGEDAQIKALLEPFLNSNNTEESVERLYAYKQSNPNFDLELHMIKCKIPLQSMFYIQHGLAELRYSSNGHSKIPSNPIDPASSLNNPSMAAFIDDVNKDIEYWENVVENKKKKLREQGYLKESKKE